ncbi:hypothetical protein V8E54_004305 [Elaphomyces granulatus]
MYGCGFKPRQSISEISRYKYTRDLLLNVYSLPLMSGNSTASGSSDLVLGWVHEPDGRGTWTIISTCLLTIFLCCWTSVCPNIPSKKDGPTERLRDKIDLACIGLLGPEFLLMLSLGQWASARVSKFHAAGYKNWTLTHAFFADMGGFVLRVPGSPDFPLDAEQLYVLVTRRYLQYPVLEKEEIDDKNKADDLSRLIAVYQGAWFSINCILRASQRLFLTTLELTTISFIVVFFVTSLCWRCKPSNVTRAIVLETDTHIDAIREKICATPQERWHRTPLDFISRQEWVCSLFWRYYVQVLRNLHIPLFSRPVTARPYDRIPSDNFPMTDNIAEVICAPILLIFCGVFMFAWNSTFPSTTELLLWRIVSVYTLVFGVAGGLFCGYCHRIWLPEFQSRRQEPQPVEAGPGVLHLKSNLGGRINRLATKLRNIDPNKDPNLEVPLRVLVPLSTLCALYCLCRAYILVEDMIEMRRLPATAFKTVLWSQYMSHW